MLFVTVLGTAASVGAAIVAGWWSALAILALPAPRKPRAPSRRHHFVVIVPAHNESTLIADTVESLLAASGGQRVEVLVVADNCSDDTAAMATGAGATVRERNDPARRGKPFALQFALDCLKAREYQPDAVVVVDADSVVDPDFFDAIASRFEHGAAVVQGNYAGMRGDSGVSELRRLALALVHHARPLGASRLGLGTSVKGNGMAMAWPLLANGLPGSGITEDAAMSVAFARRGIPVAFEPHARVRGFMAGDYAAARIQDERWEGGRLRLMLPAWRTAVARLVRGQPAAAHTAAEAGAPPLSWVAALAAAGLVAGLAGATPLALGALGPALLIGYLTAGWTAARIAPRDLVALREVPAFVHHKARVWLRILTARAARDWERTPRSASPGRTPD